MRFEMARKIETGDLIDVRGEVVRVEEGGWLRVKFPGYQYPITINPDAVLSSKKPPKEQIRWPKLRDNPPRGD
ncbi:hypothetical protein C3L21_08735 [Sinorhizobium meliloti]|nr:hypothetical protein C3L21_08735 [Sinorhizobium meliloti]